MPGKKKKYNARFPPARIKKIMQSDEEVGKVAAAVPVIISRALELFVQSLLTKAGEIATEKQARTLTPSHLKHCILVDQRYKFLRELFASVSNVGVECDSEAEPITPLSIAIPEVIPFPSTNPSEPKTSSEPKLKGPSRGRGRGRGRPRKTTHNNGLITGIKRPRGRPRKCTFIDSIVDEESNDRLEVDLDAPSPDASEEDIAGQELDENDKIPIESPNKIKSEKSLMQTATKNLTNSLLGDIQITIPQVATNSFFNNNGASTAPAAINGTGGIPVPVITSAFEFSKRPTVTNQVDEDYDC